MAEHRRHALILSYVTVGYNVVEGLISIVFALLAGSPALLGFGIDSFVESLSGVVLPRVIFGRARVLGTAVWFANRYDLKDPAVYVAKIPRSAALAYRNDREEQELICRPRSCKRIDSPHIPIARIAS
ncbi:MAG TPA: hypothetical protein VGK58_02740 [Lacipirellulaceae bacterium]